MWWLLSGCWRTSSCGRTNRILVIVLQTAAFPTTVIQVWCFHLEYRMHERRASLRYPLCTLPCSAAYRNTNGCAPTLGV